MTVRSISRTAAAIAALTCGLLALSGCSSPSPEDAARATSIAYLTALAQGGNAVKPLLCSGVSGTGDWIRGYKLKKVTTGVVEDAKKDGESVSGFRVELKFTITGAGGTRTVSGWHSVVENKAKPCVYALEDSTVR